MRRLLGLACAALVLLASPVCRAQVSVNAPPEDPVYHAIDVLIAEGLVRDVIMGQRPFSRLEVARILKAARAKLALRGEMSPEEGEGFERFSQRLHERHYLDRLLAFYEKEYARELAGMQAGVAFEGLPRFDLDAVVNTSPPRTIPPDNGEGGIDGIVTSFDQYRQGLTFADGANLFLRTQHRLFLSRYVALDLEPLFTLTQDRRDDTRAQATLHRAYAKAGISNFEVEVGRDNLLWGQGEVGGVMASANPRPLDMLKISNPYPLRIPYVGHMKWTLFVSNLGPEQALRYPYFYGLKWTWQPHRCFEFGLSHTIITAGEGAPKLGFWDPLTELFPVHKWAGANIGAEDIADSAFGFLDFRITIPPLRNSVLYYDGYIEDSIVRAFRLPDNLLNQMGFTVGWYTPRLTSAGDWGLRLEYHHTAPLQYRHGRWISGYTENRRVIGDALGPDADAAYATVYWQPQPSLQGRLDLGYEDYDSSTYYTEMNAEGGGDRILKLVSRPHERRYRGVVGLRWDPQRRLGLRFAAGYERVTNWNFEVGCSVNNLLLSAGMTLRFDEFTVSSRKAP